MSASTMHRTRPAPRASRVRSMPRQVATPRPAFESGPLFPVFELADNVRGCLAVLRAALPGNESHLSGNDASAHQVALLALSEQLAEAFECASALEGGRPALARAAEVLMYARNLADCLERALWHACVGREDTAGDCRVRAGDVAGTCCVIEEHLVEALALLRQPSQAAEGGAA